MHYRHTQGNVLMAFGFVIAVYLLQSLIQSRHKSLQIFRLFLEFDNPFVGTIVGATHVHRCSRIIINDGLTYSAGFGNGIVAVVDDDFLAKGIDEMLYPATNFYTERVQVGKLNGIANDIPPQTPIGTDD